MTTYQDVKRVRNEKPGPQWRYWFAAAALGWMWVAFVVLAIRELAAGIGR